MKAVVSVVERDTDPVFRKLGLAGTLSGLAAAEPVVAADVDRVIVPGRRVGSYEINATMESLASRLRLTGAQRESDPAYEFLLPLGYIPERFFRENRESGLRFAFDVADRRLTEIFVRTPAYHTESRISVGSPESILSQRGKWSVRSASKGRKYYVGDGVTVIVEKGVVVEIVVVRGSLPR
jgi:hypothetical protein